MIIKVLVMLLLASPPTLHRVPTKYQPYLKLLKNETELIQWWVNHQDSQQPLTDFIEDRTVSSKNRQRAWEARKKWRTR